MTCLYLLHSHSLLSVTMLQGLVDAHVHLLGGGQTLSWVDLRQADSRDAILEAVRRAIGQCCSHTM